MTPEQFNTLTRTIPYMPHGETAKGLLAPLVRATGHVLYLLAVEAQTATVPEGTLRVEILTDEEKTNELAHAAAHLDASATLANSPVLSTAAKNHVINFASAVNAARDHYFEWPVTERTTCLRNLANAAAGLAAFFDRELAGYAPDDSDPGSSL